MPDKAKAAPVRSSGGREQNKTQSMDKPILSHQSRANKPKVLIYVNGRVVGYVANGTFYKRIRGSTQLLRSPKAICFDRSTLIDAADAGATCAEIFDYESRTTYTATFETIHTYSIPVRRGHGDQVGLPMNYWSINGAIPVAERPTAQTNNEERESLQLSLFGEALQ
jgi:hypothetical protein